MKTKLLMVTCILATGIPTVHAIDDFSVQMAKVMHEETSWNYGVYTMGEPGELWNPESPWFQKPGVAVRFNFTQQNWYGGAATSDFYSPMVDLHFQTFGGVNVGVAYAHGFISQTQPFGLLTGYKLEGDVNSFGAYLGKQWDCGFNLGATYSWSTSEYQLTSPYYPYSSQELDTAGVSASLGFARSFGEKKSWRNVFTDTSANFLYQTEEESWYFLWLAKVGHNFADRFSIYGIFNLYHVLDEPNRSGLSAGSTAYQPYGDDTWGEAGGGLQAELGPGVKLTAEATIPVLNDDSFEKDVFQVRASLNWQF